MEDPREISDHPQAALRLALQAMMAQPGSDLLSPGLEFQLLAGSTAWPGKRRRTESWRCCCWDDEEPPLSVALLPHLQVGADQKKLLQQFNSDPELG